MIELIIILACLILNAFFSCFEMAFVTVTKAQLRQRVRAGDRSAERILALRENPERALSVIQVGITMVGLVSAAVGGAGAEESFAPLLEARFGFSENVAEAIAILTVVVPLTALNVVLGELVPKAIALRYPTMIATAGARWIVFGDRVLSPVITAFERATKFVMRLLPKRHAIQGAEPTPAVEIDHLSKQTQQYVLNLVGVENRRLKDVMIPLANVNFLQETDTPEDITTTVIRSGHTRLPVFRDKEVIGLLHTKEFIAMIATASENWRTLIRPVISMSENELALNALRKMQDRRSHLIIVVGPENQPLGIVTMEDIIEEVVGDLYDEDDDGRFRKFLGRDAWIRSRGRRP